MRDLLRDRELADYDEERTTLSVPNARHKVYKASYAGEPCVLKEFEFQEDSSESEWKALVREVKMLRRLAHPQPFRSSIRSSAQE